MFPRCQGVLEGPGQEEDEHEEDDEPARRDPDADAEHPGQARRPAFADAHFAQTQMVLANGALRADEDGDLKVFEARLDALRASADDPDSMTAIDAAVKRFEGEDAKLYALVRRGDRVGATELVAGTVDEAADGVTAAIGAYIDRANRERARPTRFASARAGAKRITLIIGALALLAALVLALALARHLRAAWSRSRAPPRPSPRATSTTSCPSRAATRSVAPPAPWPRWSITSARWPAPPIASPPAT